MKVAGKKNPTWSFKMYTNRKVDQILDYINNRWHASVRVITEDSGSLLGLPFPFTVPCVSGIMQNQFYWDTYFTNLGLLRQGFSGLAKNNVDNLLYMVEKYGFVPNGNCSYFLNRSQPPYLSMMVRDIFDEFQDQNWLKSAYDTLKKEYNFWMNNRSTPIGLNRYFHHADEKYLHDFYDNELVKRLPLQAKNKVDKINISSHLLAEAESGWDFTPRFGGRCSDFIPVDLNSNLYVYERNFADFSEILQTGETTLWEERYLKRKNLMNTWCWNEADGLFCDYDFATDRHGSTKSLASFHPLYAKLANKSQAESTLANLYRFENQFGAVVCEKGGRKIEYQWDYPNGWAPLHHILIQSLINYDFSKDAKRLAEKYLNIVTLNFQTTGDLWEKYNVIDGSIQVVDEYEMPAMMGWTAGVFVWCAEFFKR